MRLKKHLAAVLFAAPVFACFGTPGAIIYDNTGPWLGGYGFTALEEGDEVHAGGDARFVTRLTIGVSMQNTPGTADFVARLYANNGPSGAPGDMLWQSPVMSHVSLSGGVQLLAFDVPQVLVPNIFTWTLQAANPSPVAVGLVNADPPTVGTSPAYDWFGSPGNWGKVQYSDWMARVEAVPEPAVVLWAAAGILVAGLRGLKARNPEATAGMKP